MKYLGESIGICLLIFAVAFFFSPEGIGKSARAVIDGFNGTSETRETGLE